MGHALDIAQQGKKHQDAKPLLNFHGSGLLEISDHYVGDTYRVIYTINFDGVVYVLHAFKKKAKRGIATPKQDISLIKKRLQYAEEHYVEWSKTESQSSDRPDCN